MENCPSNVLQISGLCLVRRVTTVCFHRHMELDIFEQALDALVASDAANYGDGESMERLNRLLARLDSFITEATSAFEAGEEWAADGAKTAASWLSARCRVSRAAAKRRVRLGRTLRHLPVVAEAWRDGAIGGDQAQAIASARRHRTEASMDRDEGLLVAQAAELGFDDFYRVLAYWQQMADPDGADASEEERKASRNVYLETSLSGMWLGQITLDPISGSIVANELNRLEHDLFEADCAQAKERLGRTARIDELSRTSGRAGPTPWSRWPHAAAPPPPRAFGPPRCFRLRRLRDDARSISSSRSARCSHPALDPLDGLGLFRAAADFTLGHRAGDGQARVRPFTPGTNRCYRAAEVASARTPIATSPPRTARPTTSRPTPLRARPPKRTADCSVASTTACGTRTKAGPPSSAHHRRPTGRAARRAGVPRPAPVSHTGGLQPVQMNFRHSTGSFVAPRIRYSDDADAKAFVRSNLIGARLPPAHRTSALPRYQ